MLTWRARTREVSVACGRRRASGLVRGVKLRQQCGMGQQAASLAIQTFRSSGIRAGVGHAERLGGYFSRGVLGNAWGR